MYNFEPYSVLLSKYSCAAYDCAPGTRVVRCASLMISRVHIKVCIYLIFAKILKAM